MASLNGSTTLLIRISNAWDALRGRPCTHTVDAMSIELNVDTSKLEEGLARAKARLAELSGLVEAANLPSPRLMIKTDRKLSQECCQILRVSLQAAVDDGKVIVVEPGMTVYQLVDGKWQPVDGSKAEPLTEDEVRLAEGWTKEQVVTECGIEEMWVEPTGAALLKTKTQTFDEASAEWNIPVDRLRAD